MNAADIKVFARLPGNTVGYLMTDINGPLLRLLSSTLLEPSFCLWRTGNVYVAGQNPPRLWRIPHDAPRHVPLPPTNQPRKPAAVSRRPQTRTIARRQSGQAHRAVGRPRAVRRDQIGLAELVHCMNPRPILVPFSAATVAAALSSVSAPPPPDIDPLAYARRLLRTEAEQAESASSGGGDEWKHDEKELKDWKEPVLVVSAPTVMAPARFKPAKQKRRAHVVPAVPLAPVPARSPIRLPAPRPASKASVSEPAPVSASRQRRRSLSLPAHSRLPHAGKCLALILVMLALAMGFSLLGPVASSASVGACTLATSSVCLPAKSLTLADNFHSLGQALCQQSWCDVLCAVMASCMVWFRLRHLSKYEWMKRVLAVSLILEWCRLKPAPADWYRASHLQRMR
jgi:hypothetical protein